MMFLFFGARDTLFALGVGLVLFGLTACLPANHPNLKSEFDYVNRSVDPESAAMEAFARANLMSIDGDFEGSLVAIEQAIEIDPDSAFLYMSKAEILLHMGRVESSKIALQETLLRAPDQLEAYLTLSEVQTILGEHPAAIESLVAAQRLQPEDQQITLHLALAHARNQDTDSAILLLEGLIKKAPNNSSAYLALARIYLVLNSPQLSVDAYRALLDVDPHNDQAILELGTLYTQIAQTEQAHLLYLKFLETVPDNNRIRYQLVRIALNQDDFPAALEQLSLIIEHNPTDLDAQHKKGLIYLQQRKPALAEQVFRNLVDHNPDGSNYYALGIAFEEQEKLEEAVSAYAQIEDDSEHYPEAIIHRAYLLPMLDRRQEAITLLESQIIVLEPRPELYEFLASLYSNENAWSKANKLLETALTHFPDNTTLMLRQSFILDLSGESEASLSAAQKVLELEPDNAEALNFIAYAYAVQMIKLDEAEVLVLKAIELADAPHIRDTYGWVLYRMNRLDEALVELEKAEEGLPDDPTILDHLGDIYLALGRNNDALAVFQKALESGRSLNSVTIQKKIDALQVDRPK